jgi:hypothetical protein
LNETNGFCSVHLENIFRVVAEINTMLHTRFVHSPTTRTQSNQIAMALAFLSLMLIPSLSPAAIYKCTAQDDSITYTDEPCSPNTKTQTIDPGKPRWLSEPTLNTTPEVLDENSQAQPEILAALCAADEFRVWLKAQRRSLPERDVRAAKFIRLNKLCRRALHLPEMRAFVLASVTGPR